MSVRSSIGCSGGGYIIHWDARRSFIGSLRGGAGGGGERLFDRHE